MVECLVRMHFVVGLPASVAYGEIEFVLLELLLGPGSRIRWPSSRRWRASAALDHWL